MGEEPVAAPVDGDSHVEWQQKKKRRPSHLAQVTKTSPFELKTMTYYGQKGRNEVRSKSSEPHSQWHRAVCTVSIYDRTSQTSDETQSLTLA